MIYRDIIDLALYVPDSIVIRSQNEVDVMPITYKKLWKLLIDRNMNKGQLKQASHVSSNVIAKLGKDEPVSVETLVKICEALNVDIGDIISLEKKATEKRGMRS